MAVYTPVIATWVPQATGPKIPSYLYVIKGFYTIFALRRTTLFLEEVLYSCLLIRQLKGWDLIGPPKRNWHLRGIHVKPNLMRVLVTGAAGFIASHLVRGLLEEGNSVVGIDNFDPFYSRTIKERNLQELQGFAKAKHANFEFYEMDLASLPALQKATQAPNLVIHLAAKAGVRPSIEDPLAYVQANVAGTLSVLEFCRTNGVDQLLFGSSSSVYGNDSKAPFREDAGAVQPISPYGATKRSGELFCSTYANLYGMRIASLRFFTVYGPRQRPDLAIHKFTRLIQENKPVPFFGDGSTARDYTEVRDIVSGILKAKTWIQDSPRATHEIFNLGGSRTTTLLRLVELIEGALGQSAILDRRPGQAGDVELTYADVTKAGKILGYHPSIGIEEGIHSFCQNYLKDHSNT